MNLSLYFVLDFHSYSFSSQDVDVHVSGSIPALGCWQVSSSPKLDILSLSNQKNLWVHSLHFSNLKFGDAIGEFFLTEILAKLKAEHLNLFLDF
jgi:hypothetical protein